jgi:hypothetical protein
MKENRRSCYEGLLESIKACGTWNYIIFITLNLCWNKFRNNSNRLKALSYPEMLSDHLLE